MSVNNCNCTTLPLAQDTPIKSIGYNKCVELLNCGLTVPSLQQLYEQFKIQRPFDNASLGLILTALNMPDKPCYYFKEIEKIVELLK